ncbi:hypothetical protein LguiA_025766 [Lonicera macranthoides]
MYVLDGYISTSFHPVTSSKSTTPNKYTLVSQSEVVNEPKNARIMQVHMM